MQKRATKQLPNLEDLCYDERLIKLQLPTLAYRKALSRLDMVETYMIIHDREIYMTQTV